jgi:hypothetical protein
MPIESRISPNFSHEKLKTGSLDDLIDVFEDRLRYWLLAPAKALLGVRFGELAALSLLLGYFEPSAIYRKGEDSRGLSKSFFRAGLIEVFIRRAGLSESLLGRIADMLYEEARCGLFHEGMLREHIFFGNAPGELMVTFPRVGGKIDETGPIKSVLIDPQKFYIVVERDVTEYLKSLRDPSNAELRDNFKRAVDVRWPITEAGGIIGMSEEEFLRLSKK